ncbi:MAG: hypothetical protein M1831_003577 [Alyxoria varia]|nr:MAG: hypothetical protein M1831_003577 [Alyxoria varia]
MTARPKQHISYVLPLTNTPAGHRLGVNGLATNFQQSLLYSGGRDGVINCWRLPEEEHHKSDQTGLLNGSSNSDAYRAVLPKKTTYVDSVQAHTHWINDLVSTDDYQSLISASSDASVKLWRPHALDRLPPQVIGYHNDYVKCLASPSQSSLWIAAGGLDRLLRLWDVSGQGEKLRVSMEEEESPGKGSIYALAATRSLIACGGPDCVVKLVDPRSGRRVNRFIGHTDNVRSILLSEDGDSLVSASSDKTIKVWSVTAGRCMYSLAIHTDSVWSLYSNCPDLGTVYSGDRSGLVAKTEARNASALDQSISVGLCGENEGINRVLASGDHVWAATAGSSINRWEDIDLNSGIQIPESLMKNQKFSNSSRSRFSVSSQVSIPQSLLTKSPGKIPLNTLLKFPVIPGVPQLDTRDRDRASIHHHLNSRKVSLSVLETEIGPFCPLRTAPEETTEGQDGLIKHFLLNDRRCVLTIDSAGEVVLWDILECRPKQSFGKRNVDDVMHEINKTESVAQWCAVDTRTGTLTCTLQESHCFEAEIYADELMQHERNEFKDDQRINLGKWVLRYLFADLVNEEIRRDEEYRQSLLQSHPNNSDDIPYSHPQHISLPQRSALDTGMSQSKESVSTPRAGVGNSRKPSTPGLSISVATPHVAGAASPHTTHKAATAVSPGGDKAEKPASQPEHDASDQAQDYFSNRPAPTSNEGDETRHSGKSSNSSSDGHGEDPTTADSEKSQNSDKNKSLSKRLRSTFAPKRLGKVTSSSETQKVTGSEKGESTEENSSEGSSDPSAIVKDTTDHSLLSVVQRIRRQYSQHFDSARTGAIKTLIAPSLPSETPVLKVPSLTSIIIQEEQPDSGGVIDVFECTANEIRNNVDLLESIAPSWLGNVLLKNEIPPKETPKVTFMLRPYKDLLPHVTDRDGQERLNANRMLRAKKVLVYVAERLEATEMDRGAADAQPEEYLELYCHEQVS